LEELYLCDNKFEERNYSNIISNLKSYYLKIIRFNYNKFNNEINQKFLNIYDKIS